MTVKGLKDILSLAPDNLKVYISYEGGDCGLEDIFIDKYNDLCLFEDTGSIPRKKTLYSVNKD